MFDYARLDDLRVKLDQMTDRIISRLKDRSRFLQNLRIYKPGGIKLKGSKSISFLEFALKGLENYHASLGRFDYPDQIPLVLGKAKSSAVREIPLTAVSEVSISVKEDLLKFYIPLIKKLCKPGEDATTFGETVYCDADLLELLNERINLGRFIAESKLKSDKSISKAVGDRATLIKRLRDRTRENKVVENARKIAARYGLNCRVVEKLFKWIVEKTTKVEEEYLKRKLAIA